MDFIKTMKKFKNLILVYLGIVAYVIVPLYMRYGYRILIRSKAYAFLYCAVPAVIAVVVVQAAEYIDTKKGSAKPGELPYIPGTAVLLLALIGIWSICSSFLSQNFRLSLLGTAGWSVGSLMTVVLIAVTIFVAKHYQYKPYMVLIVMAVNVLINILAVLQSAGMDPFGLLKDVGDGQRYSYLSTIGQKNSYSGYLCLLLPLFWGLFIICKKRADTILFGAFAALGFMGIIMAESDSAYAGVGICALFMLPFVFRTEQFIKRSSILLVIFSACLMVVRYLPFFAEKTERFDGVSEAMVMGPAAAVICVLAILTYIEGWRIAGSRWGRYVLIALEITALVFICAFAVKTAADFNDSWGTDRGMIWRVGWERFQKYSLKDKLTGVGPELLVTVYTEIRDATGKNVVSAHCEPLQILLTQGLIGLGLYLMFWGYLVKMFFMKKLWKSETAIFFFPLAAYLGQSLFCSVYPVTAVLFSFDAGMYLNAASKK